MNMDTYWLAVNIYFEANLEPEKGKLAVAHVTLNRAKTKNKSIVDIIFEPKQFSWANKYGKNTKAEFVKHLSSFVVCWNVAVKAINQHNAGMTMGKINHFFNPDLVIPEPTWAKDMRYVGKFGAHKFFYDDTYA